jgi:hypothetical protein
MSSHVLLILSLRHVVCQNFFETKTALGRITPNVSLASIMHTYWATFAGHYPSVAGGEDCHSRKTGMLKSNVSSGCTLTEHTTDKRKAIDGTVSHH